MSGRLRHAAAGDRQHVEVLGDLVSIADRLLARDTSFAEVAPTLAALLRRMPAVRAARTIPFEEPGVGAAWPQDPVRAAPGAGGTRVTLGDPAGGPAVRVDLDPSFPDDLGLTATILSLLEVVCAYRDAAGPRPQPGATTGATGALVSTVDQSGGVRPVGDTLRRVLGYDTLPGRAELRELVHPDDREMWAAAFGSTLATPGALVELDARMRHASGRWVVLSVSMVNLLDHHGVNAVVLYGRDVTERRGAEAQVRIERRRQREIILQLAGGVAVDDGLAVIMTNPVFDRMLGTGGWFGRSVPELVDHIALACQDSTGSRALLTRLVESGRPNRGTRLTLASGRVVVFDLVPLGRAPAGGLGRFWYFRDVTAETAARSELEDHNRALAEAAALKSRFVATVAHELRSPLTSIVAFVDLLADSCRSMSDEQIRHLDVIDRKTRQLVRIVDDLLLLSSMETNQLSMSRAEVDVPELLRQARQEHAAAAANRDLTLHVSTGAGPPLHGDRMRLVQVLNNVIGNALKFTPPGGTVRVSARADEAGWLISVSDDGIGVPEAELPTLFGTFRRASNAATAGIPGSGLGLSICRQLVELHDGTIGITSVPGAGTTVEIALPFPAQRNGADPVSESAR